MLHCFWVSHGLGVIKKKLQTIVMVNLFGMQQAWQANTIFMTTYILDLYKALRTHRQDIGCEKDRGASMSLVPVGRGFRDGASGGGLDIPRA